METAVVRRVQFPVFTGMILRRGEEIHYIGGADVLPAPLDIQTETLMIEKLQDRKSTRLNSSHTQKSRMPSSA